MYGCAGAYCRQAYQAKAIWTPQLIRCVPVLAFTPAAMLKSQNALVQQYQCSAVITAITGMRCVDSDLFKACAKQPAYMWPQLTKQGNSCGMQGLCLLCTL